MAPYLAAINVQRLLTLACCYALTRARVQLGAMALPTAVSLLTASVGIYPDGHWNHATKLTTSNFEGFIKEQVDSGKTAFVRWIASAG